MIYNAPNDIKVQTHRKRAQTRYIGITVADGVLRSGRQVLLFPWRLAFYFSRPLYRACADRRLAEGGAGTAVPVPVELLWPRMARCRNGPALSERLMWLSPDR